jgi:hypothetical protein
LLGLEPERLTEGRNPRERCKHVGEPDQQAVVAVSRLGELEGGIYVGMVIRVQGEQSQSLAPVMNGCACDAQPTGDVARGEQRSNRLVHAPRSLASESPRISEYRRGFLQRRSGWHPLLYQQQAGLSLDSRGAQPVDPHCKPRDLQEVKALLRHSIPVSTRRLTRHLLRASVPTGWRESPLLNHCRPLTLDPADRSALVGQFGVRLDPDEGLVIETQSQEMEEPE